jgi:Fe-S-cluster containining protein
LPPVDLTATLCTHCALCCDGTLFADVELCGVREADRVELLGLEVEDDGDCGAVLALPCAGLEGTRCSVYPNRPRVCRTFECHLLQTAQHGSVPVERALATIDDARGRARRVKALLGPARGADRGLSLRERCNEVLAGRTAGTAPSALEAAVRDLDRVVRVSFLGEAARRTPTG